MPDQYKPGVGLAAGSLMVKYNTLDKHVELSPLKFELGETINVFINLESVLRNLTLQHGLAGLIAYFKQQVVIEVESSIINLVAHYRSYWLKEKTNPKVFLYYTDLTSTVEQQMKVYNKFYRDTYFSKYLSNPQFRAMGDLMSTIVIPEVELILKYIPGCYLLKSNGFDSSVIPKAINYITGRRGVVISGDVFDSLYLFDPLVLTMYIKRRFNYFLLCSNTESVVQSMLKDVSITDSAIFNMEMYFRLLLAVRGSRIRNIKGAFGMGSKTLVDIIKNGIANGIVLNDFGSLESIIELFPLKWQNDLTRAFHCCSLETQYELLSDSDLSELSAQIIDKIDMESVQVLNNKRFLDNPLNLAGLLE